MSKELDSCEPESNTRPNMEKQHINTQSEKHSALPTKGNG